MIGNLFYLCPSCSNEDSLVQKRDFIFCHNCLVSIPFKNNHVYFNSKKYSISQFYELIRDILSINKNQTKEIIRNSKKARLRQGIKKLAYYGRDNYLSIIESPVEIDIGELVFKKDVLIFNGKDKSWNFGIASPTTLTPMAFNKDRVE